MITHGMALDKLFAAKLFRMTHSYRANISSISTLDGRGADIAVCKNGKRRQKLTARGS